MTKLRFYLNMIFVLLFTTAAIAVSGNSLLVYIDIASLILGIILPYIIVSQIYTPREQFHITNAVFSQSDTDDAGSLKAAISYAGTYKRILVYSAVAWTIMGGIGIGTHIENPETLGPNFAVLVIIPLYVALFILIFIEPLRASAEKKLAAEE